MRELMKNFNPIKYYTFYNFTLPVNIVGKKK